MLTLLPTISGENILGVPLQTGSVPVFFDIVLLLGSKYYFLCFSVTFHDLYTQPSVPKGLEFLRRSRQRTEDQS